jgi:hypothetical protein
MNNMEKDIEIIERYLDQELSEQELKDFNDRMLSDKAFASLIKWRKQMQDDWNQANEFESTKQLLKKLHMNNNQSNSFKKYFMAAAAVVLLAIIIPLAMRYSKNESALQVNELESKATIEFLDIRFKQTSPVHGQILKSRNILFTWESGLDVKTAIVLTEVVSKEVYVISPIQSDDKIYLLKDSMPPGKYEWKMEGFKGSKMFIVK